MSQRRRIGPISLGVVLCRIETGLHGFTGNVLIPSQAMHMKDESVADDFP